MHGRKSEHHHYTREQVVDHLADAVAILREQGFDPVAHEMLLVAIYNGLAAKQIVVEQIQQGPPFMAIPRGVQ